MTDLPTAHQNVQNHFQIETDEQIGKVGVVPSDHCDKKAETEGEPFINLLVSSLGCCDEDIRSQIKYSS